MNRRRFLNSLLAGIAVAAVPHKTYFFLNGLWQPDNKLIAEAGKFLAPGAIELNRYQCEIFELVHRRVLFGKGYNYIRIGEGTHEYLQMEP